MNYVSSSVSDDISTNSGVVYFLGFVILVLRMVISSFVLTSRNFRRWNVGRGLRGLDVNGLRGGGGMGEAWG